MSKPEELVRALHAAPGNHKAVLAITGGGAEAIGALLRHGGGSNTLLEAVVPYDQNAFNDFVKGKPDKYCSPGAARDLAMAAYIRAAKLTGNYNVVGVGASCSLKKDGSERPGRQHFVYVAFQNANLTGSYEYEIIPDTTTTREQEETFAAHKIINALVAGFTLEGILGFISMDLIRGALNAKVQSNVVTGHPSWGELIRGEKKVEAKLVNRSDTTYKYIMPGAFNPMHTRHKEIAAKIHELHGEPVDFELCIRNVDKPPINYYDLATRQEQMLNEITGQPWAGNIYYTTTATFAEKAEEFPGATFIVGMDTYLRIGDLKYYDNSDEKRYKAIERICMAGCRFLVFNRIVNGVETTHMDCLKAPSYLNNLTTPIPSDVLPPSAMCSSDIRRKGS